MAQNSASPFANGFSANLCVASSDVNVAAADTSNVEAAGLFAPKSKQVLYAKNIHERLYPASLTKVMTALLALENGNLEDTLVASSNVNINESGAQLLGLQSGDRMSLNDALHVLLMYSGNDAAVLIAEYISGSVEAFADLMNQRALELGATNTHFINPHGLNDENHYTTAYDLYLIFNEAIKNPTFREIINCKEYGFTYYTKDGAPKEVSVSTTNGYLKGTVNVPENVNVVGGKTGSTNAAGTCLIILSDDGASNDYISVILKATDRDILYNSMTSVLQVIPSF